MSPQSKHRILVVIPAYNAEPHIRRVVNELPKTITVDRKVFQLDVVVIDDGSGDNTYEEALKTRATVLQHVMNCGAGAATRTGLRYAMKYGEDVSYVATIDSDGQHEADDIKTLLHSALLTNADMVVGNRLHAGNSDSMPLHRSFGNKGLSLISRILFNIKVKDTQSGLRLYASGILPIISDYTIDRYGFCTESLWLASRAHLNIQEVPTAVKYTDERLQHGQSNWGVVDLLLDLIWVRLVG